MVQVARVTLIRPDGTTEKVSGGEVIYSGESPQVRINRAYAPRWEQTGMDVIAANSDGSVEASFTVSNVRHVATGRPRQRAPMRRFSVYI